MQLGIRFYVLVLSGYSLQLSAEWLDHVLDYIEQFLVCVAETMNM